MRIAITGASGLVGTPLAAGLEADGHGVLRLVRREPAGESEARWDRDLGPATFSGVDAVVHLAGENIASRRWSAAQKDRIRSSRVDGTARVARALAQAAPSGGPRTLICASAIGWYGDRPAEVLDEESGPGKGFLGEVCAEWEAAADAARDAGVRVVHLRFGVILSPEGGALAKMLLPFRLGAGGRIGPGNQYMSWITARDAVRAVRHAIDHEELSGAMNAVGPHPIQNVEFTRTLGRVLKRPTIFPLPGPIARLALGEMADALLLADVRVLPRRLEQSGFDFAEPRLEEALRGMLR
jgi:uncharacterized protein (TIGR01777 family)